MKPMLLVAALAVLLRPASAEAQGAQPGAAGKTKPFEVTDNSFLVEEAFNQEKGIFQNIFAWSRSRTGTWEGSFTQEWPVPGSTHQLSYTVPFAGGDASAHVGGVLVNYRYQVLREAAGRPAFAPRVSFILPTGRSIDQSDRFGVQTNLPFSKQVGDVYFHWNAGITWLYGVPLGRDARTTLASPQLGGSVIWRARPMLHLMLESLVSFDESVGEELRARHETSITVSPGFRRGWNLGSKQIVIGLAAPMTFGQTETSVAGLTYFSYELPFTK